MIPIRDKNRSRGTPVVVYVLIGLNCAAFFLELTLTPAVRGTAIELLGFVPLRATQALQGDGHLLAAAFLPVFTSMFLHGGWLHLIGNMLYLYIFGDNVEARLGRIPFLLYYLACGMAATGLQYALGPSVDIPSIGASGAIAGVLGGYILCWPRARITTLVPIFFFITLVDLPAVVVLGFWFVLQIFGSVASLGTEYSHGGVAYGAHVGGFLAGMALIKLVPKARPRARRTKVTRIPRGQYPGERDRRW